MISSVASGFSEGKNQKYSCWSVVELPTEPVGLVPFPGRLTGSTPPYDSPMSNGMYGKADPSIRYSEGRILVP